MFECGACAELLAMSYEYRNAFPMPTSILEIIEIYEPLLPLLFLAILAQLCAFDCV